MSLRQVGEKSEMYFKRNEEKVPPKMKKEKKFDMSEDTEEIRCLSQVVSRWWCQFTSLYWVTCSLNPSKTMIHFKFLIMKHWVLS